MNGGELCWCFCEFDKEEVNISAANSAFKWWSKGVSVLQMKCFKPLPIIGALQHPTIFVTFLKRQSKMTVRNCENEHVLNFSPAHILYFTLGISLL